MADFCMAINRDYINKFLNFREDAKIIFFLLDAIVKCHNVKCYSNVSYCTITENVLAS